MKPSLVVVVVALLATAPAHASTVGVQGATLSIAGSGGENNRITVTATDTSVLVTDSGATPSAGAGCTLADRTVTCPRSGLAEIVADLGDRNDSIAVTRVLALRGRLRGGSGNDGLSGGSGPDELDGGSGRDTVTYSSRRDAVTVSLNGRADDGAQNEGDNVVATEQVTGSAGYDVLVGGAGSERLEGLAGDDRLEGGGGNDVLAGGSGADAQFGGDGNDVFLASRTPDGADVLEGGAGFDRADWSARVVGAGVVADADGRADDGDRPGGGLTFTGALPAIALLASPESDLVQPDVEHLRGTAFADVLGASAAGGRVEGLAGTDVLVGGPGTDTLEGGAGFDRILARDTRSDTITCGSETDRAYVDAQDRPNADCEHTGAGFAVTLTPLRRTLGADNTIRVRVSCPPQAAVRCVGGVRAETLRDVRTPGGRLRPARLGGERFNAPAGGAVEIAVPVDEAGRAVLKRLGGRTRVRLAARGRDEAGTARPAVARLLLRR